MLIEWWIILFIVPIFLVYMYQIDKTGWHGTIKRLSTIIRANLESSKPIKAIEKKAKNKAIDTWTNDYNQALGQGLSKKKHEIVKTYFKKRASGNIYPHYKCKCGFEDWSSSLGMARTYAKEHVEQQNKAEELLAISNGQNGWEL